MSHSQLINSLTEFYNTLAVLKCVKSSDIVHPPPGGHENIDVAAAKEQDLSDDMVALMRRLPYLSVDCEDVPIVPATKPRSYLDDDFLDWARDPVFQGFHMTKATHLVLTNPGQYGIALIYDSENGRCVPWSPFNDIVPDHIADKYPTQRAPDGLEYSESLSLPAEELIGSWTQNYISLRWMPYSENNGWHELIEEPSITELEQASKVPHLREQHQVQLVRRSLKDVYVSAGWDVSAKDLDTAKAKFDSKAFEGKREEWKSHTQALLDKAYAERWTWVDIRSHLKLPEQSASLLDSELKLNASDIQASRRMGSRPDANNPCARLSL